MSERIKPSRESIIDATERLYRDSPITSENQAKLLLQQALSAMSEGNNTKNSPNKPHN